MNLHYGSYLQLDKILGAQKLESSKAGKVAHDEHLFIVIHQIYELWFKQIMVELTSVRDLLKQPTLDDRNALVILSRLERVNSIWPILKEQISIMETMTPMDFLDFRHLLYPASGFQSVQFRQLETILGLTYEMRSAQEKAYFATRLNQEEKDQLEKFSKDVNLLTLLDQWLARLPFLTGAHDPYWQNYRQKVRAHFQEDSQALQKNPFLSTTQKENELKNIAEQLVQFDQIFDEQAFSKMKEQGLIYFSQKGLLSALFILLHRHEPMLQIPFKIIQAMIKMDSELTSWRQDHAMMAQKMLGKKIGTGGSSGHEYLRETALRHRLFIDLINLSNYLLPKSHIPPLDNSIREKMQFRY